MSHPSIQRLMNQTVTATSNRLSLREGQMFHGQIKHLYKGQMAEVQIGDQKLMARLEVPLKAGDAYFFQVKSVEPELQLKIMTGPLNALDTKAKQLMNLMESMQLPKNAEMQTLLNVFLNRKLPVSRENLTIAAHLMKSAPPNSQEEVLRSIQRLIELKLPLSDMNFKTFLGIETKEGIHGVIDLLKTALTNDLGVSQHRKESILKTLDTMGRITASAMERVLVSEVIIKLVDGTVPLVERSQLLGMMKNSGVFPPFLTLANIQELVNEGSNSENVRATLEQTRSMPFNTEVASKLAELLQPMAKMSGIRDLYLIMKQSPIPIAKELISTSKVTVEQSIDGNVMKEEMQKLFNSLGFNYEAEFLRQDLDLKKIADMLKPQLIALLNDSESSPALKGAAELALARMNGSILHSGETGMNQQIVMQLPLEFLGKRIDAQLQWNGRMKDDGKIDPEFARIMFYLDLDSIKKTVIDMQVQNRVVTVTVFNDDERLKVIGSVFHDRLKRGLESVDYKLSGVTFKKLEKEGEGLKKIQSKIDFQGVDLRI